MVKIDGATMDSASSSVIWNKIELAESFLVCCMYEKAASLAFDIEKHICEVPLSKIADTVECYQMMESAGMVLVQSWKELNRTGEIIDGLRRLHGSIVNIPVSVLLAGIYFQLAEGHTCDVLEFLEAFLSAWKYVDGRHYVVAFEAIDTRHFILEADKYFEVAEIYVVSLLEASASNIENIISWVERSILPDEKRQVLLERVRSLDSLKRTESESGHELEPHSGSLQEPKKRSAGLLRTKEHGMISLRSLEPVLWVFPRAATHRSILFGCLVLFSCYIVRRKQSILRQFLRRQGIAVKKALVDLWQLAFSHQINPLAAVQPRSLLPASFQ